MGRFVCGIAIGIFLSCLVLAVIREQRGRLVEEFNFDGNAMDWASTLEGRLAEKPVTQEAYDKWLWDKQFEDEELRSAWKLPVFQEGYMFMLSRHQVAQLCQIAKDAAKNSE